MENLGNLWPFAVGFMEKSLYVIEWEHFEKKYAHNRFSALVKKVNFSAFWMFTVKWSTLLACGALTNRSIQTHEVSMGR